MDKYNYFLFDWDGCLAVTLDPWIEAYRQAFAIHGLSPSYAEIASHLGDWKMGALFGIEDHIAFNSLAVEYAKKGLKTVELYDGAKDLLTELNRTKTLALVSSGSRDIIHGGLLHNGINDIFDIVISGEDVTNQKPNPEPLEKALKAIGGTKDKAIMIGDSDNDILAAQAFGIDSVLVYPESHHSIYDKKYMHSLNPTYVINNLNDLIKILNKTLDVTYFSN